MKSPNQDELWVVQLNSSSSCKIQCIYCKPTCRSQLKISLANSNVEKCSHCSPNTPSDNSTTYQRISEFFRSISTCSESDKIFCQKEYLKNIVYWVRYNSYKTFLIHSNNPFLLNRLSFPKNVILGTSLETHNSVMGESTAEVPTPYQRYKDFLEVKHPIKMVTIEPTKDIVTDTIIAWIENINPCMIWLGYDSIEDNISKSEIEKVKALFWEFAKRGYVVMLKKFIS